MQSNTPVSREELIKAAIAFGETVTHENYAELAHRTESMPTTEKLKLAPNQRDLLYLTIAAGRLLGSRVADPLKRLLFYGKGTLPQVQQSFLEHVDQQLDAVEHLGEHSAELELNADQHRLLHAIIGKFTEACELFDAFHQHVFEGKPLDKVNLSEERGDDFWYDAIMENLSGTKALAVKRANIAKLFMRYPNKFNSDMAVTRDLEAERIVLVHFLDSAFTYPPQIGAADARLYAEHGPIPGAPPAQ